MTRHAKALPAIAVIFGIVLCLCASPALAAKGVEGFFGGEGTEGGQFSSAAGGPGGVAVNQGGTGGAAAGDVYVVDPGNNRVQQFSATGSFKRAFGLDVGGSGVNVCTAAASCAAGTESAAAGGMSSPQGIAIEAATGNLYVTDQGNRRVDVFSAEGAFEGAFGWNVDATTPEEELQLCTEATGCQAGSEGSGEGQLGFEVGYPAISPLNGHVLVADKANRRVQELAPTVTEGSISGISFVRAFGEFGEGNSSPAGQFGASSPSQVAVDSNGTVYALNRGSNRVERFDASGSNPEFFAYALVSGKYGGEESTAIAVDPANNHVLVVKPCSAAACPEAPGTRILELSENGVLVESHGRGEAEGSGLASVQGGGRIYLSGSASVPDASGGWAPGALIFGNTPPSPPAATIEAVTTFDAHSATFTGHVNPQGWPTGYHFEYSPDGTHWTRVPSESDASAGSDSTSHEVSQEVSGLAGHTTYQVRLIATKRATTSRATAETSFTTLGASPLVQAAHAVPGATTARLEAEINPEGQQAEYTFEYVSQAQFEASGYAEAKVVTGTVQGNALTPVSAQIEGLSPGGAYRFQLVVTNPAGTETSPEVSFSTYLPPTVGLPDGRAYEQATPVEKNGLDIRDNPNNARAAEDGSGITFFTASGLPQGESAQEIPSGLTTRGSAPPAWSAQSILPSSESGPVGKVKGWSEDLQSAFVVNKSKLTDLSTLYLRESKDGHLLPIATGLTGFQNPSVFIAASTGGAKEVYFETKNELLPNALGGVPNSYIWDRETGELKLVDVLNSGAVVSESGGIAGPYDWFINGDQTRGGGERRYYTQSTHVLSRDGSIAFFSSAAEAQPSQIYARFNPTAEQSPLNGSEECTQPALACTVEVSESQAITPDPIGEQPAAFLSAAADGSKVFFMSSGKLTDDATTGPNDEGRDLYQYDTQTGDLVDLTPDTNVSDANGAEVRGLAGASEDGSYVYFVANGVLASGASAGNCPLSPELGLAGSCNLYLWHDGTTSFVARLEADGEGYGEESDIANWEPTAQWGGSERNRKSARVSSDGKTLLFLSQRQLGSYNNEGKLELYRWQPGDSAPTCVSCVPTGAAPRSGASLGSSADLFGPGGTLPMLTRNLSADGNRVFFDTLDKLVPGDTNGDGGCPLFSPMQFGNQLVHVCSDVYEWEAKGSGSCESEAQNGGCLYLISKGTGPMPSYFLDASRSGDDVFFLTRDQLVGLDGDEQADIYDARVGGGIASQNPEKRSVCEGESCKGATSTPPAAESAGTALFSGPGNAKPRHAKHKKKKQRHAGRHKKHAHKRQARSHR